MAIVQQISGSIKFIVATAIVIVFVSGMQAQTFQVLHAFSGQNDGGAPNGLAIDHAGNLYGTTYQGGHFALGCASGCGEVFRLTPHGAAWLFAPLYEFTGFSDGSSPSAPPTIGPNGSLYGTTSRQGTQGGGTVFHLQPPLSNCGSVACPWRETVLYRFTGNLGTGDGAEPGSALVFDSAGDLYGTTLIGGSTNHGTVFEMSDSSGWAEQVLHSFTGQPDGAIPWGTLLLDHAGNLYGTTNQGGIYNYGTAFELVHSGADWTESILQDFNNWGAPTAGLVSDAAGNLYGTTIDCASAFELSPEAGLWSINYIYRSFGCQEAPSPLLLGPDGVLYGETGEGGLYNNGSIFRLTNSGGVWMRIDLYSFPDLWIPRGGLVRDADGNLYGVSQYGGTYNKGIVFELTP